MIPTQLKDLYGDSWKEEYLHAIVELQHHVLTQPEPPQDVLKAFDMILVITNCIK
jgi:hypothetical protein